MEWQLRDIHQSLYQKHVFVYSSTPISVSRFIPIVMKRTLFKESLISAVWVGCKLSKSQQEEFVMFGLTCQDTACSFQSKAGQKLDLPYKAPSRLHSSWPRNFTHTCTLTCPPSCLNWSKYRQMHVEVKYSNHSIRPLNLKWHLDIRETGMSCNETPSFNFVSTAAALTFSSPIHSHTVRIGERSHISIPLIACLPSITVYLLA